jgi:hypothetical protein
MELWRMLVNGNYEVAQETAARLVPVSITCILSGTCISVLLKLTSSRVTCDTCSLKSRDAPGDRVPLNSVRRKIVDHFNGYLPRESDKPRICLLNALQNDALPWIMLKIDPHLLENCDRPYAVSSHTYPSSFTSRLISNFAPAHSLPCPQDWGRSCLQHFAPFWALSPPSPL